MIQLNHLVLIENYTHKIELLTMAAEIMARPGSQGRPFTEADDNGDGEEDMESAGWGEGVHNNNAVIHDCVTFLACGEWSMACCQWREIMVSTYFYLSN